MAYKQLQEAALAGGASLFGSGINPGWVDGLVATASSLCREVHQVRVTESFNIGLWAGDANQDVIGWGRPANDPEHPKAVEQATLSFGDAVEAIAKMFHFQLDDVRCEVEFAHATADLDVPGRTVEKGPRLAVSFSCFERRAAQLPSLGESARNIAKLVTNGQPTTLTVEPVGVCKTASWEAGLNLHGYHSAPQSGSEGGWLVA